MSKIEDALKKARQRGDISSKQKSDGRELQVMPSPDSTELVSLESRVEASRAIMQMQQPWSMTNEELSNARVIFPEMTDNRIANAFREARTKILQRNRGSNEVIMVTSTSTGGGGSFVALNLAVSFSFDESKTSLIMDCNLMDPSYGDLLPSNGTYHGLTDYLENEDVAVEDIVHPAGIQRLRIIPAGGKREVPVEYFTSLKMHELLDRIKSRYHDRFIIIDAPPILESADTQILAELCDSVLLVVPYGKITESKIIAAAKAIGQQKLAGVVFNDEPRFPFYFWKKKSKNQSKRG